MMIDKQTPIATPICNSTFPFVCEDGLHSGPQHFLLQSEGIMMTFFCYDQFIPLTYYYTQLLPFYVLQGQCLKTTLPLNIFQ